MRDIAEGPLMEFTLPFDNWRRSSDDAIQLDSCDAFERIMVKTRRSRYELIVLSGDDGDVLVRGGRFFPEFRHAKLAGSTAGGSALKLRNICAGLCMELHVDRKSFLTSTVEAITRPDTDSLAEKK